MTTNQTIDGVPCSDLELFLVYGTLTEESRAAGDRLRALLDARESCGACNGFTNGCRLDAESPPAAQPQGVPVAWQYRVSAGPQTGWSLWHDGKGEEFKQSYQVETRPLYANPPAPVAPTPINYGALDPVERLAVCRGEVAPVAVVLPSRPRADEEEYERMTDYEKGLLHGGIELWDKIHELKRLNPSL